MRTMTALYETRADAERVQAELQRLGIIDTDGTNLHDKDSSGFSGDAQTTDGNRGVWASDKGAFLPDEDRHFYEEGVRRGCYLLTVSVDEEKADDAHRILENSNAVNIDEREREYRKSGWAPAASSNETAATAMNTGAAPTGMAGRTSTGGTEERIPIVEEQLRVGKREVARGGVRVRSYVVEQPVHDSVNLREEHVSVERRPVDQSFAASGTAGALGDDAFQERDIEMTETGEEAVVGKETRVREELVVRKDVEERVQNIDDTVRHTEVEVDDRSQRLAASDTARGLGDEAIGNAKQGLGGLTGNERLRQEGLDQERRGESRKDKGRDRL